MVKAKANLQKGWSADGENTITTIGVELVVEIDGNAAGGDFDNQFGSAFDVVIIR